MSENDDLRQRLADYSARVREVEDDLATEKRERLEFQREVCDKMQHVLDVVAGVLELCRTK